MKIYTRTGDDGTTGLYGGSRVKKDSLRVEAYGTVDEANAAIGRARSALENKGEIDAVLLPIQSDLFVLGSELATPAGKEEKLRMTLISAADGERLERAIDAGEEGLPELRSFVLPGGTPAAAELHFARCVVRRAERLVITLGDSEPVRRELVIYLNRLSDLLFTLARRANHLAGVEDVPWKPRA
ncbi:MAG: cob(I)yrinic acid a,c-diamide adenosyltransferase [Polyangiales bacterium]